MLYDWETIAVSNAFVGATWVHLHRVLEDLARYQGGGRGAAGADVAVGA